MTSCLRLAAKSCIKTLCAIRDLSERKSHTFTYFIKIDLAKVRHNRQGLTLRLGSNAEWRAVVIGTIPNSYCVLIRDVEAAIFKSLPLPLLVLPIQPLDDIILLKSF